MAIYLQFVMDQRQKFCILDFYDQFPTRTDHTFDLSLGL